MGKIISIFNQKGGTGKTTSTVNIAAHMAMTGKKILLIDSDPQSNLTEGLGFFDHDSIPNLLDV
ncbi:MAG: ParA family protein, partial [archaeon]